MPGAAKSADQVAVIGDVAGQSASLREDLESLGVRFDGPSEPTGHGWEDVEIDWPRGLHIVQVGDLVHRGPDSLGVILLVDRLIYMGVWSQVVGNHEQLYVGPTSFEWPEQIDDEAASLLRVWAIEQLLVPGVSVETHDGDWLITHGGLTAGFWEHGLAKPATVSDTLEGLREAWNDGALWFPGHMLTGTITHNAGPVWAEAGFEVYPSWIDAGVPMPFSQAHGHASAYWWDDRAWRCDRRVRRYAVADEITRHVTFTLGSEQIVGVDPDHGVDASPLHGPLMLGAGTVRRA